VLICPSSYRALRSGRRRGPGRWRRWPTVSTAFRVTIATFNVRALRLVQSLGFGHIARGGGRRAGIHRQGGRESAGWYHGSFGPKIDMKAGGFLGGLGRRRACRREVLPTR